jgi:hypothetical protein
MAGSYFWPGACSLVPRGCIFPPVLFSPLPPFDGVRTGRDGICTPREPDAGMLGSKSPYDQKEVSQAMIKLCVMC